MPVFQMSVNPTYTLSAGHSKCNKCPSCSVYFTYLFSWNQATRHTERERERDRQTHTESDRERWMRDVIWAVQGRDVRRCDSWRSSWSDTCDVPHRMSTGPVSATVSPHLHTRLHSQPPAHNNNYDTCRCHWNDLWLGYPYTHQSPSLSVFRQRLKTFLFR